MTKLESLVIKRKGNSKGLSRGELPFVFYSCKKIGHLYQDYLQENLSLSLDLDLSFGLDLGLGSLVGHLDANDQFSYMSRKQMVILL